MVDIPTYVAFLGAVLAYQLSGVGPDMFLVISRGVGQGWRAALAAALGCVAAGVIQVPLLAMGLASLVTSSPLIYKAMQLVGAFYLVHVGLRLLLVSTVWASANLAPDPDTSATSAFRQGMICNLTNPTALAFMLAVLPQFVHASSGSPALQFLILGATMKATGLIILGGVALTSGAAGSWVARHASFLVWQQRIAGAIMLCLGIRLLLIAIAPVQRR
jgi:threonine/homoserine/homoserine lactone efflux protein